MRNENPNILQTLEILASTGITFSPLLQILISEVMEESAEVQEQPHDIESVLLQHDEMDAHQSREQPLRVEMTWTEESSRLFEGVGLDGNVNSVIYSLLGEVSPGGTQRE